MPKSSSKQQEILMKLTSEILRPYKKAEGSKHSRKKTPSHSKIQQPVSDKFSKKDVWLLLKEAFHCMYCNLLMCSYFLVYHTMSVCRYQANFNFVIRAVDKEAQYFPGTPGKLLESLSCNVTKEKCIIEWEDVDRRPKLVEIETPLEDVINQLNEQLSMFKNHYFIIKVQSKFFEEEKVANRIVIQVDFGENYEASFQDEIQSAHWSHSQVAIFTCARFNGSVMQSFVIISDDLSHDKYAVYTFLKTIIL
ncbi:hypothetical protein PR048_029399 [Dryococelus australis]|uniref:Uncharacterized protein n=1 Tax=Dryococelus australis TaxID=614101 RepID=A0ABQ9GDM3_9NEOP|nr:hypothetical protein PR048_029399 [Dryococelus australis]